MPMSTDLSWYSKTNFFGALAHAPTLGERSCRSWRVAGAEAPRGEDRQVADHHPVERAAGGALRVDRAGHREERPAGGVLGGDERREEGAVRGERGEPVAAADELQTGEVVGHRRDEGTVDRRREVQFGAAEVLATAIALSRAAILASRASNQALSISVQMIASACGLPSASPPRG